MKGKYFELKVIQDIDSTTAQL